MKMTQQQLIERQGYGFRLEDGSVRMQTLRPGYWAIPGAITRTSPCGEFLDISYLSPWSDDYLIARALARVYDPWPHCTLDRDRIDNGIFGAWFLRANLFGPGATITLNLGPYPVLTPEARAVLVEYEGRQLTEPGVEA